MSNKSNKVRDKYNIDEALLNDLASREKKGDFFLKSLNFYNQVKDKDIGKVTEKQKNWLWELECILHDRKQAKTENFHKRDEKQPEPIKNKGYISNLLDRLVKIFQ